MRIFGYNIVIGDNMVLFTEENIIDLLYSYNPWWRTGVVQKEFDKKMKRTTYYEANKIFNNSEIRRTILLSGARTGKSYLLFNIFYNYLIDNGISEENIIRINLESIRYENLRNLNALYNYLVSKIINNKKYYIFIDEIQLMDRFEDVVNGVKTDFNCDLYITGSNSKLLSSEINTKLRGR